MRYFSFHNCKKSKTFNFGPLRSPKSFWRFVGQWEGAIILSSWPFQSEKILVDFNIKCGEAQFPEAMQLQQTQKDLKLYR